MYIVLYCIVLYCIVLYCIVLYCIVLYCIVLYCIVLYCIVLYCIVLYCIVLYCIVLYCIVLYCIVLRTNRNCKLHESRPQTARTATANHTNRDRTAVLTNRWDFRRRCIKTVRASDHFPANLAFRYLAYNF